MEEDATYRDRADVYETQANAPLVIRRLLIIIFPV